jgi:hypothetical protein
VLLSSVDINVMIAKLFNAYDIAHAMAFIHIMRVVSLIHASMVLSRAGGACSRTHTPCLTGIVLPRVRIRILSGNASIYYSHLAISTFGRWSRSNVFSVIYLIVI